MSIKGRMVRQDKRSKRVLADGQGARKRKPGRGSARPRHMRAFRDLKARKL